MSVKLLPEMISVSMLADNMKVNILLKVYVSKIFLKVKEQKIPLGHDLHNFELPTSYSKSTPR